MIVLFLLIQIVLSINTNQISIVNDTNEIRISGEGSIKQKDFEEYNNEEKKVIIEHEITSIGRAAFAEAKLKEIEIGKDVESIEKRAFENCYELESIQFESESKLREIGDDSFKNCIKLKQIQLPKSLEKIDFKKVFENCTEIKIEIGNK